MAKMAGLYRKEKEQEEEEAEEKEEAAAVGGREAKLRFRIEWGEAVLNGARTL